MYLAFNAVHSPLHATEADLETLAHIEDPKRRVLGAMTIALDRAVGYVLDALKQQGLEKDTFVVFTNDNGAATYLKTNNGGLRGRKGTVWEGGLRVPYCASWPGNITPGQTSTVPVSTLDIGYTFCLLAGYSTEELNELKLDGGDLQAFARGEQSNRTLYWRRGNTSAIRSGPWKLITTNNEPAFFFDLQNDAPEEHNLLSVHAERAQALARRLLAWEDTLPTPRWTKKASPSYDKYLLNYWKSP